MTVYATKFQGTDSVLRYQRKLDNRIDRIRHAFELDVLRRHAAGGLFDCTIGTGRFIGALPRVTAYSGFDLSWEFIDYIKAIFPGVTSAQGNLVNGIPEPSDRYDCTICLRSLSAIGHLEAILSEMVRIVRPGGIVIFDYGRRATSQVLNGQTVIVDGEDVEAAIGRLNADVVEIVKCDALLTRIKKSPRAFRWFTAGAGSRIPDAYLSAAERALVPLFWERQIVVLRKRG
jgi:SAM-dependent methyltransferase